MGERVESCVGIPLTLSNLTSTRIQARDVSVSGNLGQGGAPIIGFSFFNLCTASDIASCTAGNTGTSCPRWQR